MCLLIHYYASEGMFTIIIHSPNHIFSNAKLHSVENRAWPQPSLTSNGRLNGSIEIIDFTYARVDDTGCERRRPKIGKNHGSP